MSQRTPNKTRIFPRNNFWFNLGLAILTFFGLTLSMATANLNKSEDFVTNTIAASNYIPRCPRISINWNPPFWTQIYLVNFQKFSNHSEIIFCLTIHKNWTKVVPWKKFFLFLKNFFVSLKKLLLKFYEVRSERGDFNWCWFWAS